MAKRKREQPKRGARGRRTATREVIQRFLIVCEGEKTEPNYFKSFRVPTKPKVIEVIGLGNNTLNVVQEAIERRKGEDYDQVWCVFDRDDFPTEHFNAALALAEKEGIRVAYSNQAFELWYLLHFHYYNTRTHRNDYPVKLSRLLGQPYKKNSTTIYQDLRERQPEAIKNATKLLGDYNHPNPADDNPSTTVHLLVEQLNRFIR